MIRMLGINVCRRAHWTAFFRGKLLGYKVNRLLAGQIQGFFSKYLDYRSMYDFLYKNLLTHFDAEYTHTMALHGLRVIGRVPPLSSGLASLTSCNLTGMSINALVLAFDHPLGLAAGFDEDPLCLDGLSALGFSFLEVGTVTPRPQPSNDGKRMIRLMGEYPLINL